MTYSERKPMRASNVLYAHDIDLKTLTVACQCPHCRGNFEASFSHDIGRCPDCKQLVFWDDLVTPEHLDRLNTALSYRNRESDKDKSP